MTCRDFTGFLDDYLTGQLPTHVRVQFETHLALCANCATYLAQYRDTIAMGRAVFREDETRLPPDVPDDLIAAILRARHT